MSITSLRARVESLLKTNYFLRDDDKALVKEIWRQDITSLGINPRDLRYVELINLMMDNKISNPDTITRARRNAQQNIPELRGSRWDERHFVHKPNVEKELRDLNS